MSSLWTDLLFLHGHIRDPELARQLANTPAPSPPPGKRPSIHPLLAALSSLRVRRCLGIGDGCMRTQ